jgi:hypothetical protein
VSLRFRWLGVAGVEFKAGNQVLAIDPFFSRPAKLQLLRPLQPDIAQVTRRLSHCNFVLVTHSHYDHLMDVPAVLSHTGARAFGSANTCQLLHLLGVAEAQVSQVQIGDHLNLGAFQVEVMRGRHSWIPFGRFFNGSLRAGLKPPLRIQDYRMDVCLGYYIASMGIQVLVCAAEPQPAQVLLAVAQEPRQYYIRLFQETRPSIFIPIHWDDFTRSLDKSLHRLHRPGRLPLWQITRLARQMLPRTRVLIPELFREYTLSPD